MDVRRGGALLVDGRKHDPAGAFAHLREGVPERLLRCGHTYAQLAAGYSVGIATVYRYIGEAGEVLAALAPDLTTAIRTAARKRFGEGKDLPLRRIHRRQDHPGQPGRPR